MTIRQTGHLKILLLIDAIINKITSLISIHNASSSAHSSILSNYLEKNQTSHKGKNVVVDSSSGDITFEDKPTVPSASSTTPSADTTNGSVGSGTTWAKADHTHPKSSLYSIGRYIEIYDQMVSGSNPKTVTYSDELGEVTEGDIIIIANGTSFDLPSNTIYKINSNTANYIDIIDDSSTFQPGQILMALKTNNLYYMAHTINEKNVSFVKNNTAYNNIKSGESTALTLANQKLINDAINTKFGNMDTVQVVVTYTDNTTETLNLFKYIGS